jgi:hypothetical protein
MGPGTRRESLVEPRVTSKLGIQECRCKSRHASLRARYEDTMRKLAPNGKHHRENPPSHPTLTISKHHRSTQSGYLRLNLALKAFHFDHPSLRLTSLALITSILSGFRTSFGNLLRADSKSSTYCFSR